MDDPTPATSSTTGLDPNLAGMLCYLLGFISGIVFLVVEQDSREVRFHAYQAFGTFLPLLILSVVGGALPVLGVVVKIVVTPLALVLWVLLMVKAFQGERFRVPWVGDWAAQQAGLSD